LGKLVVRFESEHVPKKSSTVVQQKLCTRLLKGFVKNYPSGPFLKFNEFIFRTFTTISPYNATII